jgi:hypothetical protein
MAEINGLISSSVSLAKKIYQYIDSVANAPQCAKDFAAEANVAAGVLQMLTGHLQSQTNNSFDRTSVLFSAANGCKQQFEDIFKKLEPLTGASHSFHRFIWPLHETDTRRAIESLHRYVQIFSFVFNLDGM